MIIPFDDNPVVSPMNQSFLIELFNTSGLESSLLDFIPESDIETLRLTCQLVNKRVENSETYKHIEGLRNLTGKRRQSHSYQHSYQQSHQQLYQQSYQHQHYDLRRQNTDDKSDINLTKIFLDIASRRNFNKCRELATYCNTRQTSNLRQLDIHAEDEYVFMTAIKAGDFDFCQWLLDFSLQPNQTPIKIHIGGERAFKHSVRHPKICRWLIEVGTNPLFGLIDIRVDNDYAFKMFAALNDVDSCQWIFDLSCLLKQPIDLRQNDDEAFRKGNHAVRSWLIEKSIETNNPININANDEEAFQTACQANDLFQCNWLIEISKKSGFSKINIHVNDGFLFSFSFEKNHTEMLDWLFWLSDNYHRKLDDFEMAQIRSLEDLERENEQYYIQTLGTMDLSIAGASDARPILETVMINSILDDNE